MIQFEEDSASFYYKKQEEEKILDIYLVDTQACHSITKGSGSDSQYLRKLEELSPIF